MPHALIKLSVLSQSYVLSLKDSLSKPSVKSMNPQIIRIVITGVKQIYVTPDLLR